MKKKYFRAVSKSILVTTVLLVSNFLFAQQQIDVPKTQNEFWRHVQFGGDVGLNIGSGYTNISLAPSAIYNINQAVSVGLGLQGSLVSLKNQYSSSIYGTRIIGLINPIEQIQLSVELEELKVNTTFKTIPNSIRDSFWNTGLFLGAGYRTNNVTIGARYNVLFDKNKSVYSDAFMPFVRVYF